MADPNVWKQAHVSITATGDATIVAAVSDKVIAVKAVHLNIHDAASTLIWKDGSTALNSQAIEVADGGNYILSPVPADVNASWIRTTKGSALVLAVASSGTPDVVGIVLYTEVT